jgi:hypothetical protein
VLTPRPPGSAREHDWHHSANVGNYGSFFICECPGLAEIYLLFCDADADTYDVMIRTPY